MLLCTVLGARRGGRALTVSVAGHTHTTPTTTTTTVGDQVNPRSPRQGGHQQRGEPVRGVPRVRKQTKKNFDIFFDKSALHPFSAPHHTPACAVWALRAMPCAHADPMPTLCLATLAVCVSDSGAFRPYCSVFLNTLHSVPDNPEQGALFLTKSGSFDTFLTVCHTFLSPVPPHHSLVPTPSGC